MEDDATLPGDLEVGIRGARIKESGDIVDQGLLHLGVEDDVLPGRIRDGLPKFSIFLPEPLIEHPDLVVESGCEISDFEDQSIDGSLVSKDVVVSNIISHGAIPAIHQKQDKFVVLPSILVSTKQDLIDEFAAATVQPVGGREIDSQFG